MGKRGGRLVICIKNAKVVLPEEIIDDGIVLVEDEKIVYAGHEGVIKIPESAEIFDAKGLYVGPGFVDIHVHGGGENTFGVENNLKVIDFHLSHGTTTIFPTFYMTMSKEEMIASIKSIRSVMAEDGIAKAVGGIYMEGPFMNVDYGCDKSACKWDSGEIKPEHFKELVDAAGDTVKVWAVAPEREGIEEFIKYSKKVNPKVHFAVGHSEATPEQIGPLKKYDMNISTHITNAKSSKSEWLGTRGCGPDEDCLYDDSTYAEMICDSAGVHVNPFMQKLIVKIKGIDKIILITDSSPNTDPLPEGFEHMSDLAFDKDRNLAGSRLTMDKVCRNFMKHTNSDIRKTFLAASTNPAKVLEMFDEIGSIEEGKKANFVIMDDMFNIKKVMLQGKFVK